VTDPLLGTSHFRVLIGDREVGFSEIGALTSETPASHEHGRAPGTIVLRRALSPSRDLFEWRRRAVGGGDDRRDVVILQLDGAGGRVVNSWRLVRAWPARWTGPAFDARGVGIAYEEIELAFDDLIWEPQREGA
jgi:phage tail-like protein